MPKWFELTDAKRPEIISSRVRLARNWDAYAFPGKLSDQDSEEMIKRLEFGLKDLEETGDKEFEYAMLGDLEELDRRALKERRILNSSTVSKKTPTGIILSKDEDICIILNGDDHIRLQLLGPGLMLEELWARADRLDDYINQRFHYAFDERYGYLTSFPTNMGTGLRASVVLHLPTLSTGKKFNSLIGDMSRFGTTVRGVYGEGNENYGALYEIANQKTLGQSEKEILELVGKAAVQLSNQEAQVRKLSLQSHRLEFEDEVYKSYGVLKYARRLSFKDAMIFLSQIMTGLGVGLVEPKEPCSIYPLILGIQPANLQKLSDHPLSKEELDIARADYIRAELPELK